MRASGSVRQLDSDREAYREDAAAVEVKRISRKATAVVTRLSHGRGHQLELEATTHHISSETVATQRSGVHISRGEYFNLFNAKEDRIKLEQVVASGVAEICVSFAAPRTGMSGFTPISNFKLISCWYCTLACPAR